VAFRCFWSATHLQQPVTLLIPRIGYVWFPRPQLIPFFRLFIQ